MRKILLLGCILATIAAPAQKKYRLRGYTDSTLLYYSRTAGCKMECYRIVEDDIRQVLKTGQASPGKSRDSSSTDPIFLLEGNIQDHRRIRLVATPKGTALFIITVIALGERATCDCGKKGS